MMSKKMSRMMSQKKSQIKYLPEGEILQEPHSERGRFRKENPGKPDTGEMKAAVKLQDRYRALRRWKKSAGAGVSAEVPPEEIPPDTDR